MALPRDNVTIFGIGRLGICTALVLEHARQLTAVRRLAIVAEAVPLVLHVRSGMAKL